MTLWLKQNLSRESDQCDPTAQHNDPERYASVTAVGFSRCPSLSEVSRARVGRVWFKIKQEVKPR